MMDEARIDERYISFEKIDCFENACAVLDHMYRLLEEEHNMNLYWKKVLPTIPKAYSTRSIEDDKSEELLYFVCSNVFYLEELFEKADDVLAQNALRKCELECC